MDPRHRGRRPTAPWLPRTRGDGPATPRSTPHSAVASPHTRGWTPELLRPAQRSSGFPAHAGMDLGCSSYAQAQRGLPRTRGDGPDHLMDCLRYLVASPHTRGWTPGCHGADDGGGGFPAHAGMDPGVSDCRQHGRGLPRTRGDGPVPGAPAFHGLVASPHTRGWTRRPVVLPHAEAGFPAHAGMDPRTRTRASRRPRLPRTRGDGPVPGGCSVSADVASPHTRGWTPARGHRAEAPRGFPAHAGMDPRPGRRAGSRSRLPRTRGDGPCASQFSLSRSTASPHTRGWTLVAVARDVRAEGLPRTRGDGPQSGQTSHRTHAASPHTRGWTRAAGRRAVCLQWLPRTRGDGPTAIVPGVVMSAASPHTRGWTRTETRNHRRQRGFPAHAGMDPGKSASGDTGRRLPRTRGDGP